MSGPDEPVVVVDSRDGVLAVIDASSGAVLAVYERRVPIRTFPTAADVDGDGNAEILVRYGDGRVIALEYDQRGGPSDSLTGLNAL